MTPDPAPMTAQGIVHVAFMMSLDGFVAGPGHTMDFMDRATVRDGLLQEYIGATGAILAGRDGFDGAIRDKPPYGGAWQGPIFVLTHHPEDARPAEGVTFLSCTVEEAVRIGLEAARGKNLQVFGFNQTSTTATQMIQRRQPAKTDVTDKQNRATT